MKENMSEICEFLLRVSCNYLQHGQINKHLEHSSDLKLFLGVLVSPVPKTYCLHRYQKLFQRLTVSTDTRSFRGQTRVLLKFHNIFSLSCTSCENQLALVKLSCCMLLIMKNTNCALVIFPVYKKKDDASEFLFHTFCYTELSFYFCF